MSQSKDHNTTIGQYLVKLGVLNQEQVKDILNIQKTEPHKRFGVIAIEQGYVTEKIIQSCISSQEK